MTNLKKFYNACSSNFVFVGPCESPPETIKTELGPFLNYGVFNSKFSGVRTKNGVLLTTLLQEENPWCLGKDGQHYISCLGVLSAAERHRLYSWIALK
jgi:hypothetical protein